MTDAPHDGIGHVVDIDVEQEMEQAFLEYAYSVIHSRALPDARDGLKPVQRRIVYQMSEMGLRPDRGHVKSSRVVGDVMGRLHPHGDSAIYEALVRLAQPFTLRVPLVDGHGNFGSLDAGPAAARYTEARMAPAALLMTDALDEDVVDTVDNYDGSLQQPSVLPAAFPNLLVNGASGIAVGMATTIPPHNLHEVIAACRHLLDHPDATADDLLRFVPGPDFPTGGVVVGLDGVREAYRTGRGGFRLRGRVSVESVSARRQGLVVTELPYGVGPERFMEKVKEAVDAKRLDGISKLIDLTDRHHGTRVVVEVKSGFRPEAVLEHLYRLTPLEESFAVNAVSLVEGQPRTLGLREMLTVYVDFRIDVVRRRTQHRLTVAERDLHLVEGLLVAVLDIDRVVAIIRGSDDAAAARTGLMAAFELTEQQAEHILELRLRRLTRLSTLELEQRRDSLREAIAGHRAILGDEAVLRRVVGDEWEAVAAEHGTPRRTILLEAGAVAAPAVPVRGAKAAAALEVPDEPCRVLLSSDGLLARTSDPEPLPRPAESGRRPRHDVIAALVPTTARADVGVVTSAGRVLRLPVVDLPALPTAAGPVSAAGGVAVTEAIDLAKGETAVGLVPIVDGGPGYAVGTASGVVKRVVPDVPGGRDEWEIIRLADGDRVVGALGLVTGDEDFVFVTSDARLLHYPASMVRPQGRPAGGMAGIAVGDARVVFFGAVDRGRDDLVVATAAGASGAFAGTGASTAKVTPFAEYPGKGRGTGGVRCHRFLKGEDVLLAAWVGTGPALGADDSGRPVALPDVDLRRDGSGAAVIGTLTTLGGVPG
ncbi:MAG: DNA topoisomerase (ATP-hydrolyzing) subunit A [Actinomycetales bacterium]